jgi:hypothetical protein
MTALAESEWLSQGRYLPRFLRDFHDQKDVFKWIWRAVDKRRSTDPTTCASMTWIDAHVFTIDFFLWFMARHGWTLQRARNGYQHASWAATIAEMKDEEASQFRKYLEQSAALKGGADG